jgi:hypothetical protein
MSTVEEAKRKIRQWNNRELSLLFLQMLESSPHKRPKLEQVMNFFQVQEPPLEITAPTPVQIQSLSNRRRLRDTSDKIPHRKDKVRCWIASALLGEPLPRVDKDVIEEALLLIVQKGGKLIDC